MKEKSMRLHVSILAVALALAAGCDRGEERSKPSTQSAPPASAAPSQPQVSTPTTPAPASAGSTVEKNTTQGQVDPKQRDQHRDFEHKGDAAGPRSPETAPKTGSGS